VTALGYSRVRLCLLALLCVPMIAWAADLVFGTAPIIVAAALVPAAAYALAIALVQRGAGRPWMLLFAALLWGGVGAAFLASNLNTLARAWLTALTGTQDLRPIATVFLGPLVEEGSKALGLGLLLMLRADALRSPRDGIVYGALIGVGFVAAENLHYHGVAALQGGEAGLVRSAYLRGFLGGATHAVFTASVGAGVGWARLLAGERNMSLRVTSATFVPAVTAVVLGVAAALTQHIAWNAVASELLVDVICGATIAGQPCREVPTNEALFGWATLITLAFVGPGSVVLALVARRAASNQAVSLHDGRSDRPA
jgi:RsiW-degrading membrane proteinase PrsW (M82 family)